MTHLIVSVVVLGLVYIGWKVTARNAYESAEYSVIESDGVIELRDYPDLMLVTTPMSDRVQGDDGSFGRLFRYISGGNESKQKVAMTTPVFIESKTDQGTGQMGFVIPKKVADSSIPIPSNDRVQLGERNGGTFAVIRFTGRLSEVLRSKQQSRLEDWMDKRGFDAAGAPEVAGYDPPWTPGLLRRNEILIRVTER